MQILQMMAEPMFWVFVFFILPLGLVLWSIILGSIYAGVKLMRAGKSDAPQARARND